MGRPDFKPGQGRIRFCVGSTPTLSAIPPNKCGSLNPSRRTASQCIRAVSFNAIVAALIAMAVPGTADRAGQLSGGSPAYRIAVPPGGGTDILSRVIGRKLNENLKQPVVVENRAGANGTMAPHLSQVDTRRTDDADRVRWTRRIPALYKSLPYDQARDLAPLSPSSVGAAAASCASAPAEIRQRIHCARQKPAGRNRRCTRRQWFAAASLRGTFNSAAGVRLTHIPYKGSGCGHHDVLGGQVPVYFMNILQSLPLVPASCAHSASPARNVQMTRSRSWLRHDKLVQGSLSPPRRAEFITKLQQKSRVLKYAGIERGSLAGERHDPLVASTPEQFVEFSRARNRRIQPHHPDCGNQEFTMTGECA